MKKFNMKDLREVKIIIKWEITQDLTAGTLKTDQKRYIQDFLKIKKKTSCQPIVLLVKTSSIFFLDQAGDYHKPS